MNQEDIDKLALTRAKENFPDGKRFRVENRIDGFVSGQLLIIAFEDQDNDDYVDEECYGYFTEDSLKFFADVNELGHGVGKSERTSLVARLLDTGGVTGVIAVIITIAVCYLAIYSKQIPEILGSALTMILGFYFGTKVKSDRD